MPHVIVKLWPGKTEAQKKKLAEEITQSIMRVFDYGEESASIAMEEIEPKDWNLKVYQPHIAGKEEHLYKRPRYNV